MTLIYILSFTLFFAYIIRWDLKRIKLEKQAKIISKDEIPEFIIKNEKHLSDGTINHLMKKMEHG